MSNSNRIRVATYNIHSCIGTDGQFSPARVGEVLQQLDADVIALQELETKEELGLSILAQFAEQTGMHAVPGPTLYRDDSSYGNALLIRNRPHTKLLLDISYLQREPRGAIHIETEINSVPIRVIATHFGLKRIERKHQADSLVKHLQQQKPLNPKAITIVLGDLNEWLPWGKPLLILKRLLQSVGSCATFPSRWPVLALDRVMIDPHYQNSEVAVVNTALSRVASDHLPLLVDVFYQ